MKNKSASHLILTGLFVVLVLAASNSIVRAQLCGATTNWIGGTGGWFVGTNWSNGCVPTATRDAFINNGGHAQIFGGPPYAAARSLILGDNQGQAGSVTVDSAFLDVGGSCPGNIYIGNRGDGSLTISNQSYVRSRYGYVAAVANPTGRTSNVNVQGSGTLWEMTDSTSPGCTGAGLFIGCTATSNAGGTATVDVSNGGSIQVVNRDAATAGVKVGLSGTLTGNGFVTLSGGTTALSKTAEVHGTLAPAGLLEIHGNLDLRSTANTVFHVTQQAWDSIRVTRRTGEGKATLGGRVTVIMSGSNFTSGTILNLLSAEGGRSEEFDFYSITPPSGGPCFTPIIQYDANNVFLYLQPCN